MPKRPYQNYLTIGDGGKGIPYGGDGVLRKDGDANFGFRCLKGHLERLDGVPELVRDPALRDLLEIINGADSPMFSIGCVSGPVERKNGFGWSGYIEFAWDADLAVADAQCYFPPFFHFNHFLRQIGFNEPAAFHWEIEGAHFSREDRPSLDGFAVTIWINVGLKETAEQALSCWEATLEVLSQFLARQAPREGEPICPIPDSGLFVTRPQ